MATTELAVYEAKFHGTEIDFTRQGLNEGFAYSNPNAKNMCGCGESFGV